jgi:hypothetical protein
MRWYSLMLLRLSGYRPGRRYALHGIWFKTPFQAMLKELGNDVQIRFP